METAQIEHKPMSSAESAAIPKDIKEQMLKNAKPGTWYDDWKPYCMMCETFKRMEQHDYGFKCTCCGNMIGWDLTRLTDSPLNKIS